MATSTPPSREAPPRCDPQALSRPRWTAALLALLLVFALVLPSTAAPHATASPSYHHQHSSHHAVVAVAVAAAAAELNKRQDAPPPQSSITDTSSTTTTTAQISPTPPPPIITLPPVNITTAPTSIVTSTTAGTTTVVSTVTTTTLPPKGGGIIPTSAPPTTTSTTPTNVAAAPSNPPDTPGLMIGGAAIGGLVFVIGVGILAFRCTLNRKERERRKKEMTATLAQNFERGGGSGSDAIGTPRKGYVELGDAASTSSQYGSGHKEGGTSGGGQDYYNPHYVQERYGAAHTGNYGMFEETELSVIGSSTSRPTTPYHGGNAAPNQYAGYNNYNNNNNNNGGYYGGAPGY